VKEHPTSFQPLILLNKKNESVVVIFFKFVFLYFPDVVSYVTACVYSYVLTY